ncbi:MAG: hypothetical protein V1824_00790, partial [archaeon]
TGYVMRAFSPPTNGGRVNECGKIVFYNSNKNYAYAAVDLQGGGKKFVPIYLASNTTVLSQFKATTDTSVKVYPGDMTCFATYYLAGVPYAGARPNGNTRFSYASNAASYVNNPGNCGQGVYTLYSVGKITALQTASRTPAKILDTATNKVVEIFSAPINSNLTTSLAVGDFVTYEIKQQGSGKSIRYYTERLFKCN